MTNHYAKALSASETKAWKLDDILAEDAQLDFELPFMPEALAGTTPLTFLDADERRALNHIRSHGYLCTFGLVEEFILPFIVGRLQERIDADMDEVRALLAFAGEEAKHIALFRRFREVFERGFGSRCEVIGPASAISEHVLGHGELGVGLLILHIEWMTQRHYVEMVRGDTALEPRFRKLLHEHWVEERQHARIDGWIVASVAEAASAEERARGFEDYTRLLAFLDDGLKQQVELDLRALEQVTGRVLTAEQSARFRDAQQASQRRTYLGAGIGHPRVREMLERVHPAATPALASLARAYAA